MRVVFIYLTKIKIKLIAGVVMQGPEKSASGVDECRLSEQKKPPVLGRRISGKHDTQTLDPCE